MHRNRVGIWTLCVNLLVIAGGAAGSDPQASPAEQFAKLAKQYQSASSSGRVLTDEERLEFVGQTYRARNRLAEQLVELAEKYPNDPIAIDALIQAVWQVNGTPWPVEIIGNDNEGWRRAFVLLERDHIESDKLGPVCQRIAYGFCKEYEHFLRAVLEKNPHREVQAQAGLSLAHFLSGRRERVDLVRDTPELAREFADLYGREYLAELQRQDHGKPLGEAESLFEKAVKEYGDVKTPEGDTIGDKARAALFELQHLTVGKEAPEIAGVDQEGKQFKLSDYRGSVVLLDFWNEY